jgi:hypothetical protein
MDVTPMRFEFRSGSDDEEVRVTGKDRRRRNVRRTGGPAFVMLLASCTTTQAPPKELELVPQGERFGNLVVSGAPAVPEEVRRLLAPFSHVRNTGLFAWSGDDLLVGTRFAETTQVHRLDRPMGARRQVTFFDEPVLEVAVPSDGSRFVYLRDEGGSEFYQIFEYDWASGQSQLRSNGTARYGGLAWSRAGDRFAYSTTERNGTNIDLHVQDLAGVASVALETSGGMWGVLDWSPDDSRLLVQNYVSINESYLYELELATGELVPVVDPTVRTSIGIAAYGEDDVIYFSSDMGAEFQRLHGRPPHAGPTTSESTCRRSSRSTTGNCGPRRSPAMDRPTAPSATPVR